MDIALIVTFTGMTVVFLALIALALLIYISNKTLHALIIQNNEKGGNNTKPAGISDTVYIENSAALNDKTGIANTEEDSTITCKDDEIELIAVLTAAIMSIERQTPGFKVKIKSVRRIHNSSPAWSYAGLTEQIGSHL